MGKADKEKRQEGIGAAFLPETKLLLTLTLIITNQIYEKEL
ncbi:MAG TPA: hypothetical protein PLS58_01025 [Bacteroidales bacterium]|nr:hypothetical protein [Bacteroidales bacterium]